MRRPGEAYFNGAGRCSTCHSPTGDLKGVGAKYEPATLQQRLLLPRGRERAPASRPCRSTRSAPRSTVTVTLPSGETVSGGLVRLTDFEVTLYDAASARTRIVAAQRRRAESRRHRSAAGAHRSADEVDRRRHAQHDGVSGGVEMMTTNARRKRFALRLVARSRSLRVAWSRRSRAQIPDRLVADLPRRLLRPPLQHAQADQHDQREGPDAGLGLSRQHRRARARSSAGKVRTRRRPRGAPTIKSTPLMVNGMLYFSVPDHVWAVDARTGRDVWHFAWKTRGGDHIGNRGVGILDNWLYFLTPDNYFVSLDVATGKERWHHEIANMKREYFSTNAPMVIGRQVIIGVGGDALDIPGYLESRDPESGNLDWRWNTTPRPGEAGASIVARRGRDGARRRHAVDSRHLRSGTEPLLSRHRQSESRARRARAATATTSTRARSSRSTRSPARWRGITR